MKNNIFLLFATLFLLLSFNQSVQSQYLIAPDKSAKDNTENITADDLNKLQNIFSQPKLGIKSLLEPTAIFINFDDITIYQENAIEISRNRYAGVSFYSSPLTATWLNRFQSYSYPNSLVVGYSSGYPYYYVYSVDNLTIEFAQPAKDIVFLWGRDNSYGSGQLLGYDNNNQLVANISVYFGYATWVNISLNQYSQRITKIVLRRPYVYDNRYGHIYLENFQFQPNPFIAPVGSLNSVSTTAPVGAVGWSADPDNASASNNVDCYVDGIIGQGRFIGRVLANNPSPAGVPYPGNHGFFTPLPADLRNGVQHQMYCYGIDVEGGSPPTLLTGSPKAFTWNPDSTVEFSNLPSIVEKYGEETLNVTVRNLPNPTDTTRLTFRTTNGTAVAKFINNLSQLVDELVITGNVTNQAVRIKGITESSQANNLIVEARIGNSPTVKASRIFTIATITSLVFEKFDVYYTDLDNNGQPLIASQRIFPDKEKQTDYRDRSLVKVKATISPVIPNVQIYFANFDLDDPSAIGAPIDTNGSAGDDNNGSVMIGTTPSSAGQLSLFSTTTGCSATVGKANCVTGSDGTLTIQFKTTMQPGDNFAIAASLSESYRNAFWVYPSGGTQILNGEGNVIHISGEDNFDESPGIRTKMLTVWRRLHIEVDSMGVAEQNYVVGNFAQSALIGKYGTDVQVNTSPQLEPNRFENGRLVSGPRSFRVISNTTNTVRISVFSGESIEVDQGEIFQLYDDDDFNDDDGENKDGDTLPFPGEDIVENSDVLSWVQESNSRMENRFADAYIMPSYYWASEDEFNDTDATFILNVPDVDADIAQAVNQKRNSANLESNEFWVAYLLFSYQGALIEDSDPVSEFANGGIGTASLLTDGPINGGPVSIPPGSVGSLIYLEITRDYDLLFDENTQVRKTVVPHEVGHQFGLKGDTNMSEIFGIMNPYGTDGVIFNPFFVPRHINVLRRRVSSPGQ